MDVFFDDVEITVERLILQENHYYPFGLNMAGIEREGSPTHEYQYNGKEKQEELGLNWADYGARMYDVQLGRWHVVDPAADLLEMSSPYAYAVNSPIIFLDKDGELPILINGRVASDSERGNASYWDRQLLTTIKSSGIPNPGGELHFVDGDRYTTQWYSNDDMPLLGKGEWINSGNFPQLRHNAGYWQAKRDFKDILHKLAKDPESGKIIEKIQIYSHSRGAAFATGYTESLLELISQHADQFADPSNVIDYVLHLAPHQSGSLQAFSDNEFSIHHTNDALSGNNMKGVKGAFESNIGNWTLSAHSTTGFINEVGAFINSYLKNEGSTSQSIIDDFVNKMMNEYGINVTVK